MYPKVYVKTMVANLRNVNSVPKYINQMKHL